MAPSISLKEIQMKNEWISKLKELSKRNSNKEIICASVKQDGHPKVHQITFRDFLPGSNLLIFSSNTKKSEIMGLMKHGVKTGTHDLLWNFPSDAFTISGKIYVIASSRASCRFGIPPNSLFNDPNPEMFWEDLRIGYWKSISAKDRATYTWPVSGKPIITDKAQEMKQKPEAGYKYTNLEYFQPGEKKGFFSGGGDGDKENLYIHAAAEDSCCLLVFRPDSVDHVNYGSAVPIRIVHWIVKDQWTCRQVTV